VIIADGRFINGANETGVSNHTKYPERRRLLCFWCSGRDGAAVPGRDGTRIVDSTRGLTKDSFVNDSRPIHGPGAHPLFSVCWGLVLTRLWSISDRSEVLVNFQSWD